MRLARRILAKVLWIFVVSCPCWSAQQTSGKGAPSGSKNEQAKQKATPKQAPKSEPAKLIVAGKTPSKTADAKESPTSKTPAKPVEATDTLHTSKATRYASGNKRDPFLNLQLIRKKTEEKKEEVSRGQPPPGIAGMSIAQVALMGTSQKEGSFTAVFRGTDKRAYFLHEGDRLFDGYVKQIKADSVLMVRETKLRSGEVMTEEVTKQLRTP